MAQPFVEPCSRGTIEAAPVPRGRLLSAAHRRMVLAACVLASSMAFIDGSALTVALPNLRAALSADLASGQWVLNGYVLALALLTLIGGALVLVTPLTASVLSSVAQADEALASGINNAASRIAQLAGVALAAGLGSIASGHKIGFIAAAAVSLAGALVMALTVPPMVRHK